MLNDKMVNTMKRQYIIPTTVSESFRTEYICQTAVNSVGGGVLEYGDIEDPGNGL